MGNWFSAASPETSQHAETQREAGSSTVSAHSGGVVNTPRLSGVHVGGNININTYVQQPASTEQTHHISPTTEDLHQDRQRESPQKRLLSVRAQFVNSASEPVLKQLLDELFQKKIITQEEMDTARTKTKAEMARDVIDMVRNKGPEASLFLIEVLRGLDPYLAETLGLS